MTTSLVLWCSLLVAPAMSSEPPAPARVPGADVPAAEAPSLPRLAEPGGAEALAELLEVEWASFEQVRALDFPVLSAHWVRIGNAFFGYSTMMARGEPVIEEWSIVAPRMLSLATLVNRSGLALVEALPEDDPTREARLAGLA